MLYQSNSAPPLRLLQRLLLVWLFLFTNPVIVYLWMFFPQSRWYDGRSCTRFGLLVTPGVLLAIRQYEAGH